MLPRQQRWKIDKKWVLPNIGKLELLYLEQQLNMQQVCIYFFGYPVSLSVLNFFFLHFGFLTQGDRLNMAVFFWYLRKSDLSSVQSRIRDKLLFTSY